MRTLAILTLLIPVITAFEVPSGPRAPGSSPGRNGLIAFSALHSNGAPGIVSIRPDGRGRRHLTRGVDRYSVPSPDGKLIAFVRRPDPSVWLMRADGSSRRNLAYGFSPSWSPNGRRIAFESPVLGGYDVSIVNTDGTAFRRLSQGDLPSWSPDGSRIAFYRFLAQRTELYTIRPDGSGEALVSHSASAYPVDGEPRPPAWSPDGKLLAFVAGDPPARIVIADAVGASSRVFVTSLDEGLSTPIWSPDGRQIAYVSFARGQPALEVARVASGVSRQVAGNAMNPTWSPDGRSLAFTTIRRRQLFVVPGEGGRKRQLTREEPTSRIEGSAAWGKDGRILFAHTPGSDWEIMTASAGGNRLRQLTHNQVDDLSPAWSSGGGRIAFTRVLRPSPQTSNPEIYVMRANGGGARRLTHRGGYDQDPSWSPDGRIVFGRLGQEGSGLAVMRLDGRGLRILIPEGSSPSWSPDGAHIAFSGQGGLYVVSPD
jgi:Tol biopolymer transport system component